MGIVKSLFQRDPLGDDTSNETQGLTGNKYPQYQIPDASPSTKEQIEGLRAKANDYRQRYHDLSRRAKQAYSSGHKADAHTFSQQAHANKEEMEDADRQAVDLLIRQQQASINQGELDLHGFYVNEAIDCVRDVLADQSDTYQLTVITGKGLHSTGGVARIRPAVISYLEKHNYRYTLCPGVIEVGIQTVAPRKPRGDEEECCVIC
ncbi:uncharacterized protein [Haliotis cracherodii]|uniref:uncharacterized protein n=1 Tax=Haliotis cracherodii TaxID=6455 RepID=UPI0039E80746